MPTYEYRCSHCERTIEVVQKMSDPELCTCPDCHRHTLTKLVPRSFGVQFKGSGFYGTDYAAPRPCCGGCGCRCSKNEGQTTEQG